MLQFCHLHDAFGSQPRGKLLAGRIRPNRHATPTTLAKVEQNLIRINQTQRIPAEVFSLAANSLNGPPMKVGNSALTWPSCAEKGSLYLDCRLNQLDGISVRENIKQPIRGDDGKRVIARNQGHASCRGKKSSRAHGLELYAVLCCLITPNRTRDIFYDPK